MAEFFVQHDEHVECWKLGQVERGITVQHFVIEPQIVETNDEIGALQFVDEVIYLRFAVDFIFAARGAVSHADAHAHLGNVAPAADFIGGLLRFEIEVNNVLGHGTLIYDMRFTIYEPFSQLNEPRKSYFINEKNLLALNFWNLGLIVLPWL